MSDYKCIIQQVSNVVEYEYKINDFASAGFKVFSPHLTYISILESLNLGQKISFRIYLCGGVYGNKSSKG
jgi:hypothetical protein